MTVFDDDVDMWEQTWADCLLKGEPVDGDHGLTGLVAAVRATADVPPPTPNAALAALLREGLPTVEVPAQRSVPERVRYWGSRTFRVTVAGVAASLAMGAGVATAAAGSGGPLSYVPEPVKRGVDAAVTAVADVLRSSPETTAPGPTDEPTSDSGSGTTGSARVPAPAKASEPGDGSSPATAPTAEPVSVTTRPSPTTTPAPATPAPTTTSPSPAPGESSTLPPSSTPSPSQDESPSPSPTGDTRKPLDNEASPSPTPTQSQPESEQPPAEGETGPVEDDQAASGPSAEPKKGKPARGELTVERILPSA